MTNFEYITPQQIANDKHNPFSIGQVRHYLIHRHKNGLASAVRKIGKRLYIRKDLFEEWIEAQCKRGQ